jgi:predicted RNA-binding protein YlxR (DUF448 family)
VIIQGEVQKWPDGETPRRAKRTFGRGAYEICLQRACREVRALKDLLEAELQLEKAAGRAASRTKKEERDVR